MGRNITSSRGRIFTIGELASRSGVHLETIRYFERIGLLARSERSAGGHRLFSAGHLARLNFIRRAREMGFSQSEVRALLSLSDGELMSCGEVKRLAENHLTSIRQKNSRPQTAGETARLDRRPMHRGQGAEVPRH